jgi:NADH:ubiquinone oxidoreductase subunit 4 (subunit M)
MWVQILLGSLMLLFLIIFTLGCTTIFILVSNLLKIKQDIVRSISLVSSIICFFISLFFWILFDRSSSQYQFTSYEIYTVLHSESLFSKVPSGIYEIINILKCRQFFIYLIQEFYS